MTDPDDRLQTREEAFGDGMPCDCDYGLVSHIPDPGIDLYRRIENSACAVHGQGQR